MDSNQCRFRQRSIAVATVNETPAATHTHDHQTQRGPKASAERMENKLRGATANPLYSLEE
jgi:hypothetical protein